MNFNKLLKNFDVRKHDMRTYIALGAILAVLFTTSAVVWALKEPASEGMPATPPKVKNEGVLQNSASVQANASAAGAALPMTQDALAAYAYDGADAIHVPIPNLGDGDGGAPSLSAESVPAPTATPLPLPTPTPTPQILKQGVKDDRVIQVQERLMDLNYMDKDEPTPNYGSVTRKAIEFFQRKHDLAIDGVCGDETYRLLMSDQAKKYSVSIGFSGTDVQEIQIRLRELGYMKNVTDYFGEETEAAVKEFQKRNKLTIDGTVGAKTKDLLFSAGAKAFYYAQGTSGEDVLKLQKRLQQLGYLTTKADGKFGADTVNAVKRFQEKAGLIGDGHAGPETLRQINSKNALPNALEMGDSGIDVTNIQKRLVALKYLKDKADGYFGSMTQAAVREFQRRNGLGVDGRVGAQTVKALLSPKANAAGGGSGASSGGSANISNANQKNVQALIKVAKSKLGKDYNRGAKGPNSFDCSGFVYWCLNQIGVKQGYLTSSGWASNRKYPKINSLGSVKAGDILSFRGHVGIALGGGQMIDASSSRDKVKITNINSDYWRKNFVGAFRVL